MNGALTRAVFECGNLGTAGRSTGGLTPPRSTSSVRNHLSADHGEERIKLSGRGHIQRL